MDIVEIINNNINTWIDNLDITLSQDLNILENGIGYMSNKEVLFNPTGNIAVINPFALKVISRTIGLGKALNNACKKIQSQIYFNVCTLIEQGKTPAKATLYPFELVEFKRLFVDSINSEQRLNVIETYIENADFLEMINKATAASAIGNTAFSPYWIDWEDTFKGINDETAINLMLSICTSKSFNMPDQFKAEHVYDIDIIKSSPIYHFLLISQPLFKQDSKVNNHKFKEMEHPDTGIRHKFMQGAFNEFFINSKTKRNPFINYVYQAYQRAKWLPRLLNLIDSVDGKLIYFPFFFTSMSYRKHSDDFLESTPFVKVIRSLGRENKTLIKLINAHNSFECISDIPENYFLKVSEAKKANQNYVTSTGLPYKAFERVINQIEKDTEWNTRKNYKPFSKSQLNPLSHKRLINADKNRKNPDMGWAEGKLSNSIKGEMSRFANKASNSNKANNINTFAEWIISLPDKINTLHDISSFMIYDPTGNMYKGVTFYEYIKSKKNSSGSVISLSNQKATWSVAFKILETWAKLESTNLRAKINNPIPPVKELFKGERHVPCSTHRRLIPSYVYEELFSVATENDYAFAKSQQRFTSSLLNHQTKEMEMKFRPHCARIIHLLLLVPLRGKQARWLDEGLMDSELWDFKTQKYKKNNGPLANYVYEDGKNHESRHGNTGVIFNPYGQKNKALCLYISTNKTKSEKAQRAGETGYEIPWPYEGADGHFKQVYDIIESQKTWNDKYCPASVTKPVKTTDENAGYYDVSVWDDLPYFTPLFRNPRKVRLSAMTSVNKEKYKSRDNLYLPISADELRSYFKLLLEETDRIIKLKFPELKNQNVLFKNDGTALYDLHGLRVFGISTLLNKGVDEKVVQMLVGHATAIMTVYYQKIEAKKMKELLIQAQNKQGATQTNELAFLRKGETLICNFGLVPEWQNEDAKNIGDPNRTKEVESIARLAGGGICFGYSCAYGGLTSYINFKGQEVYEIKQLEQGAMRCGNCRYWKSGPRFILEQIYHFNLVVLKISELAEQRTALINKSKDAYNDSTVENPEFMAANYSKEVDDINVISSSYVQEFARRQAMLEETFRVSGLESTKTAELDVFNKMPKGINSYENLSAFEGAMEVTTQGAVLGVNLNSDTISFKKLKKFLTQVSTVAGVADNLIFKPDDEVKRAAILYKIQGVVEDIGRAFTDEEFNDARFLVDTLNNSDLLKIKKHLISADREVMKLADKIKIKKLKN
ncbi:VPA1269 family protein [Colwellia sp. Arc7-D]|uniref:VPA1269 family protein n=1 Tax=Colwellia sp. Arc7-D TaxID=2161872 RepID=UPI000D3A59EE|nr:VPA1269 family protein [Colwellia sp. Arc7-D]AWB57863.1 hypothetical protein DBO93_09950 [Colwellia sp. Arc7-D]